MHVPTIAPRVTELLSEMAAQVVDRVHPENSVQETVSLSR